MKKKTPYFNSGVNRRCQLGLFLNLSLSCSGQIFLPMATLFIMLINIRYLNKTSVITTNLNLLRTVVLFPEITKLNEP